MPDVVPPGSESIAALVHQYREMKHDATNGLAVILALAEMTRKNPVHLDRLCELILERGPRIVDDMARFGVGFRQFAEAECGLTPAQLQPPESSGETPAQNPPDAPRSTP